MDPPHGTQSWKRVKIPLSLLLSINLFHHVLLLPPLYHCQLSLPDALPTSMLAVLEFAWLEYLLQLVLITSWQSPLAESECHAQFQLGHKSGICFSRYKNCMYPIPTDPTKLILRTSHRIAYLDFDDIFLLILSSGLHRYSFDVYNSEPPFWMLQNIFFFLQLFCCF